MKAWCKVELFPGNGGAAAVGDEVLSCTFPL